MITNAGDIFFNVLPSFKANEISPWAQQKLGTNQNENPAGSRWKEVVSQLDEATVISLVRMRRRSNYVYSS